MPSLTVTSYAISLLYLGGLLSFLKENEGEVDLREKGRREYTGRDIIYERKIKNAFNRKIF